jgi:hypothetical protein
MLRHLCCPSDAPRPFTDSVELAQVAVHLMGNCCVALLGETFCDVSLYCYVSVHRLLALLWKVLSDFSVPLPCFCFCGSFSSSLRSSQSSFVGLRLPSFGEHQFLFRLDLFFDCHFYPSIDFFSLLHWHWTIFRRWKILNLGLICFLCFTVLRLLYNLFLVEVIVM